MLIFNHCLVYRDTEFTGFGGFKTKFPILICDDPEQNYMNVLGVDFLTEFNFTFVFNPKKKAYIENDDSTTFE